MRKINFTVKIEDNDLIEFNLIKTLENLLGSSLTHYKKFPNVDHLKEDKAYKNLLKIKNNATLQLERYINDNHNGLS